MSSHKFNLTDFGLSELWSSAIMPLLSENELSQLSQFLFELQGKTDFCPAFSNLFRAFDYFPPAEVNVLILGQDPYHDSGQADGLAFSVPVGFLPWPPSLRNIFREVIADTKSLQPENGSLEKWAYQGVLLLNSVLTVSLHQPGSHRNKGWEAFSRAAITAVNNLNKATVFILWGKWALAKADLIDESKHLIISSAHPSPLSSYRGFFGSKPFSKANSWLETHNKQPVQW